VKHPPRGRLAAPALVLLLALPAAADETLLVGGGPFCTDNVDLAHEQRRLHWAHVLSDDVCPPGRTPEPAGDWRCDPVPVCGEEKDERCVTPTDVCREGFRRCRREYRCHKDSPEYNREALLRIRHDEAWSALAARTARDGAGTDTCGPLAQKLSACRPFTCERTHPVLADVTLRFAVAGPAGPGCRFEETLAGGYVRECVLPPEARAKIDEGLAAKSRSDVEAALTAAIAMAECDVRLASPAR
jgi:hypothetical protein